jgi:hypothetical protein
VVEDVAVLVTLMVYVVEVKYVIWYSPDTVTPPTAEPP